MEELDFERNLGFLFGDIARLTRTSFDRRVASLGLTRSQWWVLTYVYRDQGMSQSDLAGVMEVSKVTLGGLIDRLEKKGWVERRDNARDRRTKRVYLTEDAHPVIECIRQPAQELYETMVSGLSKAEQETLIDLLLIVRKNLVADNARKIGKDPGGNPGGDLGNE